MATGTVFVGRGFQGLGQGIDQTAPDGSVTVYDNPSPAPLPAQPEQADVLNRTLAA